MALSADITSIAAGKRRGFCQLRFRTRRLRRFEGAQLELWSPNGLAPGASKPGILAFSAEQLLKTEAARRSSRPASGPRHGRRRGTRVRRAGGVGRRRCLYQNDAAAPSSTTKSAVLSRLAADRSLNTQPALPCYLTGNSFQSPFP